MKRIISFSLWGDKDQYVGEGAVRQAETQPEYFPGWRCRFYYDGTVPQRYISALMKYPNCELVRKPDAPIGFGLYWRFEPMFDDPDIERFLVRDTDSAFSDREAACVQKWIESDKDFHVIRDNRSHETAMLGGTWGAKARCMRDFRARMGMWFQEMTPDSTDPRSVYYGSDQTFLTKYVWLIAQKSCLAHDEHFKQYGETKPFPVPALNGHYVGMVWDNRHELRRSPSCTMTVST